MASTPTISNETSIPVHGNSSEGQPSQGQSIWSSCLSCSFLPGKWNPNNWNAEMAKKIAHIAGVILAVCVVGLAIYTFIPGAYYAIFAIVGIVSLMALVIGIVKYCKQNKMDPEDLVNKASNMLETVEHNIVKKEENGVTQS